MGYPGVPDEIHFYALEPVKYGSCYPFRTHYGDSDNFFNVAESPGFAHPPSGASHLCIIKAYCDKSYIVSMS